MANATDIAGQIKAQAALVLLQGNRLARRAAARSAELELLIHDAQARDHRRAAYNRRDRDCYRLGSAFEPVDGLGLDPVALTGLLALGSVGVLLLARVALQRPEAPVADHLATLFRSPVGPLVRDHGVWVRWNWLRELYQQETAAFLASVKGSDPKARWRAKKPTKEQNYLVERICLDLQLEQRDFATRGEAFDWIRHQGGNPRFKHAPPIPDIRDLAKVFQ